jgi:chromosome segregation ATPase
MGISGGHIRSELERAETTLKELEAKFRDLSALMEERKAEKLEIEGKRHTLEATGDINKLMTLKRRSISLDKLIGDLSVSENDCLQRIESAKRYLDGLNARLDKLRHEAVDLSEKISMGEVPAELLPQVKSSLKRVQMQIESLTGQKQQSVVSEPALTASGALARNKLLKELFES